MCYGDEERRQFNVCPFCGSTLLRGHEELTSELMAIGYDEEMKDYGIVCGIASDDTMASKMMERWRESWKYIDLIDLNPDFNIGDKYPFDY